MTIHKLTHLGGRRTACGLTVPDLFKLGSADATWNDGDGGITSICAEGCYVHKPEAPSSPPRPAGLQRFTAVAKTRNGEEHIGTAIVNRNGTISVYLNPLPVDGKLTLVPA